MAVQRWHHVAVQHVHCTCSCCYSTSILQRSETSTNKDARSLVPDKLITQKPDSHTGRVWPARAQTAARAEARKKFLCLTETRSMDHQTRLSISVKMMISAHFQKQKQCIKSPERARNEWQRAHPNPRIQMDVRMQKCCMMMKSSRGWLDSFNFQTGKWIVKFYDDSETAEVLFPDKDFRLCD